jgi:hypothetical protein
MRIERDAPAITTSRPAVAPGSSGTLSATPSSDSDRGGLWVGGRAERRAGLRVHRKPRRVGVREGHHDAMARVEYDRRAPEIDLEEVDVPGSHQLFGFEPVAKARTEHSIGDEHLWRPSG